MKMTNYTRKLDGLTPFLKELLSKKPNYGYKLLHVRKNGTLSPLFINKKQVIPLNTWMIAEDHKTPKFAHRPGWHICSEPNAPHIKLNPKCQKRAWFKVQFFKYETLNRPQSQGGIWFIAKYMKILEKIEKI